MKTKTKLNRTEMDCIKPLKKKMRRRKLVRIVCQFSFFFLSTIALSHWLSPICLSVHPSPSICRICSKNIPIRRRQQPSSFNIPFSLWTPPFPFSPIPASPLSFARVTYWNLKNIHSSSRLNVVRKEFFCCW